MSSARANSNAPESVVEPKQRHAPTVLSIAGLMKAFCVLFVLTSVWTAPLGSGNMLGRLALADVFAGLALVSALISFRTIHVPRTFLAFVAFLATLIAGVITSFSPQSTMLEIVIHLFAGITFLVLVNTFEGELGISQLILAIATATFVASALGIVDLLGSALGLPSLFQGAYGNGTFRNTGQAGTFIFTALSILIPVHIAGFPVKESRVANILVRISIALGATFLLLTLKRAAIAGFAVSLLLTVVMLLIPGRSAGRSKIGLILGLLVTTLVVLVLVQYVMQSNPSLENWYHYKMSKTTAIADGDNPGFVTENWGNAIRALGDHPFLGTGIGAFGGHIYGSHEVHSTYFKILGETGTIGALGYLLFLATVSAVFVFPGKRGTQYFYLLQAMLPFYIGNLVSWVYTYHVRKREFWILLAVAVIVRRLNSADVRGTSEREDLYGGRIRA